MQVNFANFAKLYGVFSRTVAQEAQHKQDEVNRKHNFWIFEKTGDRIPTSAGIRTAAKATAGRTGDGTARCYGPEIA